MSRLRCGGPGGVLLLCALVFIASIAIAVLMEAP